MNSILSSGNEVSKPGFSGDTSGRTLQDVPRLRALLKDNKGLEDCNVSVEERD